MLKIVDIGSVTSNLHGHRFARRRVVRHLRAGSRRWWRSRQSSGRQRDQEALQLRRVYPGTPALVMPGVYQDRSGSEPASSCGDSSPSISIRVEISVWT